MPNYRRAYHPGGIYFFTIVLRDRKNNDLLVRRIDTLRMAIRQVKAKHPFSIHAWVVLPEHMHCVISLPEGDADFALRIRLIKTRFSKILQDDTWRSTSQQRRGERNIWQARYWEHLIRDDADYAAHIDYVHLNPLKHGCVTRISDWPHSTFHRHVERGIYPLDWAGNGILKLNYPD